MEAPSLRFKAIVAMARNRVIGHQNRIPWHLSEDLRFFKRMTTGQVVVMGRRTFESIGKPLPNRETVVLTGQPEWNRPGVRVISGLSDLEAPADGRAVFICGGARVYEEALPWCSDLYVTHVHREVDGDTFFPPFEHLFEKAAEIERTADFDIVHYRRRAA